MKGLSKGFWSLNITQFLGAFNDNAYRILIILLAVEMVTTQVEAGRLIACASIAFILPFLLFSVYAGYLADKYSKTKVIISVKAAEIVIMIMGFFAFLCGSIYVAIGCLFFMGAQSAFFGPSKYGILPEMLDEEHLSMGNGLISMFTNIAIIIGMVCGTYLSGYLHGKEYIASLFLIAVSITGFITSFFITKMKPAGKAAVFRINFIGEIINNLKMIKNTNKTLLYCIAGGAYYWFIAALCQSNILVYGKFVLEFSKIRIGLLLVLLAMGIGCGSLLAGMLGRERIEVGFIPLGAFMVSIISLMLGFSYTHVIYTMVLFFALGVSAGIFLIPISAFVQYRSPGERRGTIMAVVNFLSFTGILLGYGLFWVFSEIFRSNPARISVYAGFLTLLGTVYLCWLIPEFLIHLVIWLATHSIYKIKITGSRNIPHRGPALIVCNHTSFIDAPLLVASTSRFIHFLMSADYKKVPVFRYFCKLMKVIFISPGMGHARIEESFEQAREYLKKGNVVAIFAGGTGSPLSSKDGYGRIIEGLDIHVIPVNIEKKWGDILSYNKGRFLKKFPRKIPYPVTITYGKHL